MVPFLKRNHPSLVGKECRGYAEEALRRIFADRYDLSSAEVEERVAKAKHGVEYGIRKVAPHCAVDVEYFAAWRYPILSKAILPLTEIYTAYS